MSNQVNSMNKGLTVKDLVTTGIFTALLFVFVLVGGVFFATNPVLTFFMPAGGGLLAGPIYLLLIAKVHKRWSLSIMGVIMGIIWFVTGMHWAFALGYLIMAIVADFVAGAGQYKSKKLNSLSYILFSLLQFGYDFHSGVERAFAADKKAGQNGFDSRTPAVLPDGTGRPNRLSGKRKNQRDLYPGRISAAIGT